MMTNMPSTVDDCGLVELRGPEMQTTQRVEHILQFFAFEHLPGHLQAISKPFADMAHQLMQTLPQNAERTVAFRKLLEAKDAAVRALIAK